MIKVILFFLIVIFAGMTGTVLCNDLKKRREEIENFLLGVRIIEAEITYAAPPLDVCFFRAAERMTGEMKQVFLHTSSLLKKQDAGGEKALQTTLGKQREYLALTERDLTWMGRLGIQLGVTDLENELKNIKYILRQGEDILKDAEQNEKKWCKVITVGSWLFGFAAALTVI